MTRRKPILGLRPKSIWEWNTLCERRSEISLAMDRYISAKKNVPWQWLEELKAVNEKIYQLENKKA